MSEAPSRTGSSGRKESDRYSKKASIQAFLPRVFARASALTSASVLAWEPEVLFFISGRLLICS
jgi:hypothetical protein